MKKKKLKYPPEFKIEVCRTALNETIRKAAAFYGVNKDTVRRWLKEFNEPEENSVEISEQADFEDAEDEGILYIYFDVIASTVRSGKYFSLYQFNIYNDAGTFSTVGFAASKDNYNICIFLDYVLTTLKELKRFEIRIIKTNIFHLAQKGSYTIFKRIIKKKFDVDLRIIRSRGQKNKNIKIDISGRADTEELITEAYKKMIYNQELSSLSSGILIPPIFVEDYIRDYDNIISFSNYWNVLNLPEKQSGILFNVIKQVEKMADEAKIGFEFDKAMDFYHRIYLTASCRDNTNDIRTDSVLKQAEIKYQTDDLDSSEQLLKDCLGLSRRYDYYDKAAEAGFYLGMINYFRLKKEESDKYFEMAIDNYRRSGHSADSFQIVKARVKKEINLNSISEGPEIIKNFISEAEKNNKPGKAAAAYGLLGQIEYFQQNYSSSEQAYISQYKTALSADDYTELCLSISNLINLYAYRNMRSYEFITGLLEELKLFSVKTKRKSYVSEANMSLGIYFYKNKDFIKAVKHLEISLTGFKIFKQNYKYISNLHYLGRSYYLSKNYLKAAKVYRELLKISKRSKNHSYILLSSDHLGQIYYMKKNFKKALSYFLFVTKMQDGENIIYFKANAYKFIGIIRKNVQKNVSAAAEDFSRSREYFNKYAVINPSFDVTKELEYLNSQLRAK